MSHVNAEKTVTGVVKAGAAKMINSPMGKMGMGSMMTEGMSSMMKEGMGPMMMGSMGPMMSEGMGSMMKTPGIATGAVVYTGSRAGKSVARKIFTHPLVLFGLGVAVGCYVYKYRKSIISTYDKAPQEE